MLNIFIAFKVLCVLLSHLFNRSIELKQNTNVHFHSNRFITNIKPLSLNEMVSHNSSANGTIALYGSTQNMVVCLMRCRINYRL